MTSEVLTVDHFIGGVSQQPESLRDRTKADAVENAYLSPVDGFGVRPPLEHLSRLLTGASADTFCHLINRDGNERYMVVARDGDLKVFGLDGTEYGVYAPGGGAPSLGYITGATPSTDFRALTLADYTLFLNRSVAVEMTSSLSDNYTAIGGGTYEYAYVWCLQTAYETEYQVDFEIDHPNPTYDGLLRAEHTTLGATTGVEDTDSIISSIFTDPAWYNVSLSAGSYNGATVGLETAFRSSLCRIRINYSILNEVIGIRVGDGVGDKAMRVAWREVDSREDLPRMARDNQIFKVGGDPLSEEDDYWVRFSGAASSSNFAFEEGTWEESLGIDLKYELDDSTMPHQLVRKQDDGVGTITGTPNAIYFEWGPVAWEDRMVGDDETNPIPSFVSDSTVSRYIEDIFFHKNRLGFVSNENVILSVAGDYFNFWRTTVRDLLDSDRIDTAAAHTKVSILKNALSYNGRLLAFSAFTQFMVDSPDIFSPASVEVRTAGEFDNQTRAKPVNAGRVIFFPYTNGSYSGIREFYQLGDSIQYDAVDITKEVPQYLVGEIRHMAASTMTSDLIVVPADSPGELYIYKYLWSGQEKVQSAWSKWTLGSDVVPIYAEFIDNDLYVVLQRGNEGLFLERMTLQDGGADPDTDYRIHLDRRVSESDSGVIRSYDSATDRTTIQLPYLTSPSDEYWVVGRATPTSPGGEAYPVVQVNSNSVEIRGDQTAKTLWIGTEINARLVPTRPYAFSDQRQQGVQIHGGRQTVRRLSVTFDRALAFKATISSPGRDDIVQEWNPNDLDQIGSPTIGSQSSYEGRVSIPVIGEVQDIQVELASTGPYPFHLGGAEWEVRVWQRAEYRGR